MRRCLNTAVRIAEQHDYAAHGLPALDRQELSAADWAKRCFADNQLVQGTNEGGKR
jgi:hypothetical protein